MKIPKIKWYFFPVENTDYLGSFGVDGFLWLSLRKRLIAGEQNIDWCEIYEIIHFELRL